MNTSFYNKITEGKAYKSFREGNKDYVLSNLEHLDDLISVAFTISDKNHHKAFWVIELICEKDCSLFLPYIDDFIALLPKFKDDKAKRPVSRVCMFLTSDKHIQLTSSQQNKLIENCFDWLINNEKIAVKAYAMKALYFLSKTNDWVIPDFKQIVTTDFPNQSAGYKACTKEILRKLK